MINVIKTIHLIDIVLPIVNVTIVIFFLLALINLFTVLKNFIILSSSIIESYGI